MEIHDILISKDLSNNYTVSVWKNQWVLISEHRFKFDAEEIRDLLEKGTSIENLSKVIDRQNLTSKSKLIAN